MAADPLLHTKAALDPGFPRGPHAQTRVPHLRATSLTYEFTSGSGAIDVSCTIDRPGRSLAVVGPNGSGKSTLLSLLATSRRPTAGEIRLNVAEEPVNPWADAASLRRMRTQLGVAFQTPCLDGLLTTRENLRLAAAAHGIAPATADRHADDLLARFNATDLRDRRTARLSGGERRRVDIARAMMPTASVQDIPKILILDEPTTGLDSAGVRTLTALVTRDNPGRPTVIAATHDLDLAARCDLVLILRQGRAVACQPPSEVISSLGHAIIRVASADLSDDIVCEFDALAARVWVVAADGSRGRSERIAAVENAASERSLVDILRDRGVPVRVGPPTMADALDVFAVATPIGGEHADRGVPR